MTALRDELDQYWQTGPIHRVRLLTGADFWTLSSAIGLRAIVTSDGPVGVRGARWNETDYALTLPCPTALAATWNEELGSCLDLMGHGVGRLSKRSRTAR